MTLQTCSMILNTLIVVCTVGILLYYLKNENKTVIYRFFTTDSNVLAAVTALVVLIAGSMSKDGVLPEWVVLLKFVGTTSVMVTLLTVLFFLGPTQGYKIMFVRDCLYMHLAGPLFAFFSFVFCERQVGISLPASLLGTLPVVLYAILYVKRAVFQGEKRGGWPDFYGFNVNGMWKVSLTAMLAATLVLSLVLAALHNAFVC